MKRGTCTGCGQDKPVTTTGLIGRHGPLRAACPGAGLIPAEIAVRALREILDELPVFSFNGAAVVRLDELNDAVARAAGPLARAAANG